MSRPDEPGETASHTVLPPKERAPDQTPPALSSENNTHVGQDLVG